MVNPVQSYLKGTLGSLKLLFLAKTHCFVSVTPYKFAELTLSSNIGKGIFLN